jgi:hypothetical protein
VEILKNFRTGAYRLCKLIYGLFVHLLLERCFGLLGLGFTIHSVLCPAPDGPGIGFELDGPGTGFLGVGPGTIVAGGLKLSSVGRFRNKLKAFFGLEVPESEFVFDGPAT